MVQRGFCQPSKVAPHDDETPASQRSEGLTSLIEGLTDPVTRVAEVMVVLSELVSVSKLIKQRKPKRVDFSTISSDLARDFPIANGKVRYTHGAGTERDMSWTQ